MQGEIIKNQLIFNSLCTNITKKISLKLILVQVKNFWVY